jgi:hypothetical protein
MGCWVYRIWTRSAIKQASTLTTELRHIILSYTEPLSYAGWTLLRYDQGG